MEKQHETGKMFFSISQGKELGDSKVDPHAVFEICQSRFLWLISLN